MHQTNLGLGCIVRSGLLVRSQKKEDRMQN